MGDYRLNKLTHKAISGFVVGHKRKPLLRISNDMFANLVEAGVAIMQICLSYTQVNLTKLVKAPKAGKSPKAGGLCSLARSL